MWIDQSTRRTDGPHWACAACGQHWPRELVGTPFPADRCYGCGGELVTAPHDDPAMVAERQKLATPIWALADDVGNTKLAWRHALTPEERAAFDAVTQRLLRLGTQVNRGEVEADA